MTRPLAPPNRALAPRRGIVSVYVWRASIGKLWYWRVEWSDGSKRAGHTSSLIGAVVDVYRAATGRVLAGEIERLGIE